MGIVQIVNELASRGLCDLLLPSENNNRRILKAARKRFTQAASAIVAQSKKLGLVIIIDAADNAQLEADRRHEDAFPKLLLSMLDHEPIDGVKLVLTARTHRKDTVIDRATVETFELGPFTEPEARQFLEARRSNISEVEFATVLSRSVRNARVLDYLLTNREEAAMLTGKEVPRDAARELMARGPQAVVVKCGELGALLTTRRGTTEITAYRVKVRDTTCAGDSFVAGFLLGLSRGWPLDESLQLANAAGALCTTQIGHRAITSLEGALELIKTQSLSLITH